MSSRREFITLLGGAAMTWPLPARAQQPARPLIGFVSGGSPDTFGYLVDAFREGLSDAGFVEGRNVAIEFRWAEGRYERLPTLLADLVQRPGERAGGDDDARGAGGQGGDWRDPDRVCHRRRPGAARAGREP